MGHVIGQLMSRSLDFIAIKVFKWIVYIDVNMNIVQVFHGPLNRSNNFSKDLWGWTQTLCFLSIDRHKEVEEAFCLKVKVYKPSQPKDYLRYLMPTLSVKQIELSNTILVIIKIRYCIILLYFRVMQYFLLTFRCSMYLISAEH